jgi:hypothetical protein
VCQLCAGISDCLPRSAGPYSNLCVPNPTDLVGRTLKECHTVVLFEADSDTARMSLPG